MSVASRFGDFCRLIIVDSGADKPLRKDTEALKAGRIGRTGS